MMQRTVEAAIALRGSVDPAEIDRVLVETYRLGVKGHDHTVIDGIASAKLSTPYAVAAVLLYGRADLTVFEPLDNNAVALAAKVSVVENESFSKESARKRIALVRVYLKDGSVMEHRVDYAKGEPENPMTADEMREKQELLSGYFKTEE